MQHPEKAQQKICVATFALMAAILLLSPAAVRSATDHALFDELLLQYNHQGSVDYAGFKREEARLDAYLDWLAGIEPASLGRQEQFAFYINAYNAWTIKLILSGYPGVRSIKDLGGLFRSPWKKKFVRLGGDVISLDEIEHGILRPRFKDPRVHFAINCASKSCPHLYREAFVGHRLDEQLDDATRNFINDTRFNRLEGAVLFVSSIFKWFREDFSDDVMGFFIDYAQPELKANIVAQKEKLKIKYLDYDWSLNGQ